MKVERICYEQLFPTGIYANQRLRVEISLDDYDFAPKDIRATTSEPAYIDIPNPDEVVKKYFAYAKQLVNEAFEKMNPQITWAEPIGRELMEYKEDNPDNPDKALIDTLNYCTSITMLEKFRPQVERRNNTEVTAAFENKLKSLQCQN